MEIKDLSIGETAQWVYRQAPVLTLWFQVTKYHFADEIEWGEFGQFQDRLKPPEGAKFLWVYVRAQNQSKVANTFIPSENGIKIVYERVQMDPFTGKGLPDSAGSPVPFRCAERYQAAEVYPDVIKEGWILRVVPKSVDISKTSVQVAPGFLFFTKAWRFTG